LFPIPPEQRKMLHHWPPLKGHFTYDIKQNKSHAIVLNIFGLMSLVGRVKNP